MQKDNGSFEQKAALRANVLRQLEESPVILESHGGFGKLYLRCYRHVAEGVVFEKNPDKADALAAQRPTWAVYEGDCVKAIAGGVGAHLTVNFVDMDPYGEPWPVMDAFFGSERPRAQRLALVVNDGMRQALQMHRGWSCPSLRGAVEKHGNQNLYKRYLAVCRELVEEKAARAGYRLISWTGYYTGIQGHMSHYAAMLDRG
jgi:hypothetical protein